MLQSNCCGGIILGPRKDQLVTEACAATFSPSELAAILPPKTAAKKKGRDGLKARAAAYLSAGHRENPQAGCPFAALGSELASADDETRATLTAGLRQGIELFAEYFDNVRPDEARRRAIVVASLMSGALTLAWVVDDPKLSDAILRNATEAVCRLYDQE